MRFPRGNGVGVPLDADPQPLPIGVGETLREGDDIALIGAGTIVAIAQEAATILAAEGIEATVINARSVKPLDETLILDAARRCGHVITIEENVVMGGFGAGVLELLAREGVTIPTAPDGRAGRDDPARLAVPAARMVRPDRREDGRARPRPPRSRRTERSRDTGNRRTPRLTAHPHTNQYMKAARRTNIGAAGFT